MNDNPLPSWADTPIRQRIIDFVTAVTTASQASFIEPENRIAVFDNDGTLWSEQPYYVQFAFTLDRVRAIAPDHPEWQTTQPFKAVLENDLHALMAGGMRAIEQLLAATHAGMTTDAFAALVTDWVRQAAHPSTKRLYTAMAYQPMLELLSYLRDHDFKNYIVSAGGVEFMRAFSAQLYGVPPEQVLGSTIETSFVMNESGPVLMRLPALNFVNDGEGKPLAINRSIGRRPVIAFGNSDGDHQMLQWTAGGKGPRLMGLIHHTDAEREWAYDYPSSVGELDQALTEARLRGWLVVDMKRDWRIIHAG